MSDGTLEGRIAWLIERHGSLRSASRALDIDAAYLKRMLDGDKVNPSDAVLKKLCLTKIVTYRIRSNP